MDERTVYGSRPWTVIPRGRRRSDRAKLDAAAWRDAVDDDLDEGERDRGRIRSEIEALELRVTNAITAANKPLLDSQQNTNRILISLLLTVGGGIIMAIVTGQIGPK